MLTGRVAFDGGTIPATLALITFRDPEPPSRVMPGLPPGLDALVARALAKNPADRHANALEFAEDLEDVAGGRTPRHQARRQSETMGTLAARAPPLEALLEEADLEPLPLDPPARPTPSGAPIPPVPATAPAASWLRSRRGLLILGGALAAAGLAVLGLLPGGNSLVPAGPLAPLAGPSAQLEVDLEHSFRSGTLRVYVDDDLALEEPLESYVSEDLVVLKLRKGRERATIKVRPGEREVRVQVSGDGWSGTRRITGSFDSGQTRRLYIRMGGLLNKELRASWGG